jgi:uncharacterized membrane protein YdcZ (DUF606 family)
LQFLQFDYVAASFSDYMVGFVLLLLLLILLRCRSKEGDRSRHGQRPWWNVPPPMTYLGMSTK